MSTFIPLTQSDRERFNTQKAAVLKHLQAGKTITQEEAKAAHGIMRLASRIDELRREGWNVVTTMIPAGQNGANVARYSLGTEPRRKTPFIPVVPENIPEELKVLRQWVVWRGVRREDRMTKVPYGVATGRKASSTDPDTWCPFEDALAFYTAGNADGIGFVFAMEGGIVGVDLDKCVGDAGEVAPPAESIVRALDSYTEFSVSGKGLHVLLKGTLPKGKRKGPIEIYPSARYFTVTGHVYGEQGELRENQAALDRVVGAVFGKAKAAGARPSRRIYCSNAETLDKAMAAKNGDKFRCLWEGDWQSLGYPSQSEADLALLSMLMYWTDGDEDRASVMFSQSGLARGEWERADYRRRCFERLRNGGLL